MVPGLCSNPRARLHCETEEMHAQKVHTYKKEYYKGELLTLHKIHISSKDDSSFLMIHLYLSRFKAY